MNTYRWVAAGLGLIMFLLSFLQLEMEDRGLNVTHIQAGELPVTLVSPDTEIKIDRPLVLIGDGVAG